MLVVETFTGENIKLRVYVIIGWGKATFNFLITLFFNFVNSVKEEKENYILMYVPCILCNSIIFVQEMYHNNVCFLQHSKLLRCLYLRLRDILMYTKGTKLKK